MLHPKQFEVNEAWIAFRLNRAPIRTERDGDFNCIALMDAASCFLFGSEFIPVTAEEPTRVQVRRLLKKAKRHKDQLPKTLFVARGDAADLLTHEATRQNIEVVRIPENELLIFTREARDAFAEHFEEGRWRLTSSCSGPSYPIAGAPQVRHFIMHMRRAGHVVARPLNCGVSRHFEGYLNDESCAPRAPSCTSLRAGELAGRLRRSTYSRNF